ncbi:hypothetical protein ACFYE9_09265 [Rhizobium leguminosarum]|uniref:Uncharacterized protein n=2 Tax=Rhizobium leguminosarum TaxID=384 RepID=A0A154I924_RHILE|nr:hypothetical protein A4A59_32840 [Rhizobium leguminosarum]
MPGRAQQGALKPRSPLTGQSRTKLTKSPVGSAFPHDFIDQYGRQVEKTYIIQPDRSLIIAHRQYKPIRFFGD